jgi:hypothetical protein|tara:strand:- start:1163 stop:1354 length:192 start_codon:yes stop_codon:yes gene_type:complete
MLKQIKSHWYYVFWGIATVSVVAGQVYVGTGYRDMANEIRTTRIAVSDKVEELTSWMPWVNWD